MAVEKAVLFNIGEETYGIDIADVQGIEKYINILSVPNTLSYIEGIINLRGDVIPIFSLRKKFGLPLIPVTEETKLIIGVSNGTVIGFEVDMVKEIVEIPEKDIVGPPIILQGGNTKYVGSVAHVNDGLVVLLNLNEIISQVEKENIQELIKNTQE